MKFKGLNVIAGLLAISALVAQMSFAQTKNGSEESRLEARVRRTETLSRVFNKVGLATTGVGTTAGVMGFATLAGQGDRQIARQVIGWALGAFGLGSKEYSIGATIQLVVDGKLSLYISKAEILASLKKDSAVALSAPESGRTEVMEAIVCGLNDAHEDSLGTSYAKNAVVAAQFMKNLDSVSRELHKNCGVGVCKLDSKTVQDAIAKAIPSSVRVANEGIYDSYLTFGTNYLSLSQIYDRDQLPLM